MKNKDTGIVKKSSWLKFEHESKISSKDIWVLIVSSANAA